jgi:putrescine transport system permease protein
LTSFVTVVVQSRLLTFDRSLEEAAMDPRLPAVQDLPHHHPAADLPGHRRRLDAGVHVVVRRSGDRELLDRPGRDHLADADLFRGAARVKPEINAICTIMIAVVAVGVIAATLASKRNARAL